MRREDFNYPSADKRTEIHAVYWLPEGDVRAVLQIAHGMAEYIDRYEPFASYLADQGILVVGNDHLGHGKSIAEKNCLGYFPPGGNRILLRDMHTLRQRTAKQYHDVPYFMMGHSMGSFLVRQYLCCHGSGLCGAVIMGTGDQSKATLRFASVLSGLLRGGRGGMKHSRLLNRMVFSGYMKHIKEAETGYEWLSRDDGNVWRYVNDPLCGFPFTNSAFYEMFRGMLFLKNPNNLLSMPKELPVFFVSGAEDPVGGYGRGVKRVEAQFRTSGLKDLTMKLYTDDRHEILNEADRNTVYQDISAWLLDHAAGGE